MNNRIISSLHLRKSLRSARSMLLLFNYYLNRYKKAVWLIGEGRSGTTWVSSLINHNKNFREMFEPFHPGWVTEIQQFPHYLYLHPHQGNESIKQFSLNVFTGKFTHPRVDANNNRFFYEGLLVKDIYCVMLLPWVQMNFPGVRKILLMRHPFAVALSRSRIDYWHGPNDPLVLLEQKELLQDFLGPFESYVRNMRKGFFESVVLIWAITHYVAFQTMRLNDIYVVFYENIYADPEAEVERIYKYLDLPFGNIKHDKLLKKIHLPSKVVTKAANHINSPITSWKKELTKDQIKNGLAILKFFEMDKFYFDNCIPNMQADPSVPAEYKKLTFQERANLRRLKDSLL